MAKTPGSRWKREAAANPDWIFTLETAGRFPRPRCPWNDKPGHLHGGPDPAGYRCPVCADDWRQADALTRRLWRQAAR